MYCNIRKRRKLLGEEQKLREQEETVEKWKRSYLSYLKGSQIGV
jgi:hypothetical protein